MITVYEAKPTYPLIEEKKVDEIKGQRVYYSRNGKLQWDIKITSYSGIFESHEEAKQHCINYANGEIASLNVKLERAKKHLEKCNNL